VEDAPTAPRFRVEGFFETQRVAPIGIIAAVPAE
jgi:hypothetical protein